jgi:hypothetical protein
MIGNMPSFNNAFGTKQTIAGKGCTTAENTVNMMLPFLRMRPLSVTENSTTTEVQADAVLDLSGAVTALTLGSGAYKGVELKVINDAAGAVELLSGTKIITACLGETLDLRWNGSEWRVKTDKLVGDIIRQFPSERSPEDKCLEGTWVQWSGKAVMYGASTSAPPAYDDYYALAGTTIAANSTPVVCYHQVGSDYRLYQFKAQTAAYTVPAEPELVKWTYLEPDAIDIREAFQQLAVRDPETSKITVTEDLQIGSQITQGIYTGKYVTEVIVPGGKFSGVEGGFRPTFIDGGVQQGRIVNFSGYAGIVIGNPDGVLFYGDSPGYQLPAGSGNGLRRANFDPSRVVLSGPDNAPENLSERWWRRVA